jgi:hypothetical protein
MKCWYFRSDQRDPCIVPLDKMGVTFGPVEIPGVAEKEYPTWHATWDKGNWSWHWGFAPVEKMSLCPGLAETLRELPTTATLDEFCAALESAGFRNHYAWINSAEYLKSREFGDLQARLGAQESIMKFADGEHHGLGGQGDAN